MGILYGIYPARCPKSARSQPPPPHPISNIHGKRVSKIFIKAKMVVE